MFRALLYLVPLVALAQDPPPEVDQALRARVSEFYQYHIDGPVRKAIDLVAEDTKDFYFAAQKAQFKSFKIDNIKFSDNFTRAEVQSTVEQMVKMRPEFPEMKVQVPSFTTWKIEEGKWCYYRDPTVVFTPFGTVNIPKPKPDEKGAIKTPSITPDAIASAASAILKQSSVDKSQVTLATDRESSDQVVFHNGSPGFVRVGLQVGGGMPGFSAVLDKAELNIGENATVKLRYVPSGNDRRPPITVRLILEPFNQVFDISVTFAPTAQPPKQ